MGIRAAAVTVSDKGYAGERQDASGPLLAEALRAMGADVVEQSIVPHRKTILTSKFGPALRRHVKELHQARQTYGPVRLSKA